MKKLLVSLLFPVVCFGGTITPGGGTIAGGGGGNFTGTINITNVIGLNTNGGFIVQTNFVIGQLYTNNYGYPIQIYALVTNGVSAVSGVSEIALATVASSLVGGWTNYVGLKTTTSTIVETYTNIISLMVPTNAPYYFTNYSVGAGDNVGVLGGQVFVTSINTVSSGGGAINALIVGPSGSVYDGGSITNLNASQLTGLFPAPVLTNYIKSANITSLTNGTTTLTNLVVNSTNMVAGASQVFQVDPSGEGIDLNDTGGNNAPKFLLYSGSIETGGFWFDVGLPPILYGNGPWSFKDVFGGYDAITAGNAIFSNIVIQAGSTITGNGSGLTNLQVTGIAASGTPSSSTYLRGDATWATVSGGGGGNVYSNTTFQALSVVATNSQFEFIATNSGNYGIYSDDAIYYNGVPNLYTTGTKFIFNEANGGYQVLSGSGMSVESVSTSASASVPFSSGGITNNSASDLRVIGFTGTSVVFSNGVTKMNVSLGTISSPVLFILQPNEMLYGTGCTESTNVSL